MKNLETLSQVELRTIIGGVVGDGQGGGCIPDTILFPGPIVTPTLPEDILF